MPEATLPPLREVIERHGLRADKRLGQHFILDPAILARIVALASDLQSGPVVEIGPGPGGLTRALLDAGAQELIAVERDPRCVEALRDLEIWAQGRLRVVEADALDWDGLGRLRDVTIVANLPYNIATPLLLGWFGHLEAIRAMVLMFQKEVGDRLRASPNSKAYGRLSVMTQWLCRVRRGFELPPGAFSPPPKVSSTVIGLEPQDRLPSAADRQLMAKLTQAAFGQRRKMIKSALRSFTPEPLPLLQRAGIEPTARAEQLDLGAFVRLLEAAQDLPPDPASRSGENAPRID